MDFIKALIAEHGSDLIGTVAGKAGFSADQAEAFVPAALENAVETAKGCSDPASMLDPSNIGDLIGQMDIGALASKVGIGTDQASSGLKSLLPMAMQLLGDKAGGLGAIAGLLGGGGIAGKLGGLAGGLLGKK